MSWQLLEEVACARPPKPGPEWWTLVDIALDARNGTRQSMCGQDYLMQRGKCSRATLYRRLEALQAAGLIRTVRKAAPGVRAIYEIAQLHGTGLTNAETHSLVDKQVSEELTGLSVNETRPDIDGSQNLFERVSKSVRTGLSVSETHTVINAVIKEPSPIEVLELDGPVESGRGRPDQEHHGDVIELPPRPYVPRHGGRELAAWQAAESRKLRTGGTP